jgi:hypothetical protein
MRRATVFEQKNALPGSELHLAINNRTSHWCASRPCGYAMACHHCLRNCAEIIRVFRDQSVEELLQVTPRGRVGIFHDDHAATGMLDKNGSRPFRTPHSSIFDCTSRVISYSPLPLVRTSIRSCQMLISEGASICHSDRSGGISDSIPRRPTKLEMSRLRST